MRADRCTIRYRCDLNSGELHPGPVVAVVRSVPCDRFGTGVKARAHCGLRARLRAVGLQAADCYHGRRRCASLIGDSEWSGMCDEIARGRAISQGQLRERSTMRTAVVRGMTRHQ